MTLGVFLAGSQPDEFSFVPEVLIRIIRKEVEDQRVLRSCYRLPDKIDRLPEEFRHSVTIQGGERIPFHREGGSHILDFNN